MKKFWTTLGVAAALFSAQQAQAQDEGGSRFYVKAGAGYGMTAGSNNFGYSDQYDTSSATRPIRRYNSAGTLGAGATFHAGFGVFISEHFAFDLDFYYLLGNRVRTIEVARPTSTFSTEAYTRQMRVAPSLKVFGGHGAVKPYARFGLLLPVGGKTMRIDATQDTGFVDERIMTVKGSFSVGFESGVGVEYGITEQLSLFGEVNYSGLFVKSKTATIDQDTRRDNSGNLVIDRLETATTYDKEINFVDELTRDSNSPFTQINGNGGIDENKPSDQLASRTNFNAVSIRVGAMFKF